MIQVEDLRLTIKNAQSKLAGIGESLNIPKLQQELDALMEEQHKANFWDDVKNAQAGSQRAKNIEDKIANYTKLCEKLQDVVDILDMFATTLYALCIFAPPKGRAFSAAHSCGPAAPSLEQLR